MALETKFRKLLILGFAVAAAVLCLAIAIYYMIRADSANKLNSDRPSAVIGSSNEDIHLFD